MNDIENHFQINVNRKREICESCACVHRTHVRPSIAWIASIARIAAIAWIAAIATRQ